MESVIKLALHEYGVKEISGPHHNPQILKYFEYIGQSWVKDDETSWCSAFANFIAKKAGLEHSGKLDARSWLKVGEETDSPNVGDIVVLWRDSKTSWKGHVGFFVNADKERIYILGGNQNNRVCIMAYPIDRLLSYRKLRPDGWV